MRNYLRRIDSKHIAKITENPPGRFSFVVVRGENNFESGGGHAFEPQTLDDVLEACRRIIQRDKQPINFDVRSGNGIGLKIQLDREALRREQRSNPFSRKVTNVSRAL